MSETAQQINLIDREQLEITGVKEVVNYNDQQINLVTNQGRMLITGEELHIEHLDTEELDLEVTGKIVKLEYNPESRVKGFLQRLFK